jgi:tetratricopeptide (TPR) repeat protein
MALAGCGDNNLFGGFADDSSKEARMEEALMALDDGRYSTAISILNDLLDSYPDDDELLQYLSSAYSGLAGLDTLNLLQVIDELDSTDDSGSIDMVGLVLGDANGVLTSEEVTAKLANINNALNALNSIATLNDDQTVLLGVLSITHISLTLADIIIADQGLDTITLTDEGIGDLYDGVTVDLSDVDTETLALEEIDEDIENADNAIDELDDISDGDNDLAQDFEEFINAIDQGEPGVSQSDLETYITNLASEAS